MHSVNPATGETFASYEALTPAQIEDKLSRAQAAFQGYRKTSFAERAAWMARAAEVLEARKHELGELATREMGKTLAAAVAEVEKCAKSCRYYAQNAEKFLADEQVVTEAERAYVTYQPLGVVLSVMPWNFPYWQVFRFIGPVIMAGNAGLLKHASNVPGCALAIESVMTEAGFPQDVFQTLLVGSKAVEAMLKDDRIKAVSLTGSERAGEAVGAIAGKHLKKVVLELGGSDPFIVLSTHDMAATAEAAVAARIDNTGQSCNAAKRILVVDGLYDAFVTAFRDKLLAAGPEAPLSSPRAAAVLAAQVDRAVAQGAQLASTGQRKGAYFPAGVLTDVHPDNDVYHQELFGPVAQVHRVRDEEHAVEMANDTPYGLGSYVFTTDPAQAQRVADQLDVGMVFINGVGAEGPELPFGGTKRSGFGRELGRYGMDEFVNKKLIRTVA